MVLGIDLEHPSSDNRWMETVASPTSGVTSDAANRSILVREIDGELVALDAQANLVHQLNTTATLIWRLAKAGRSPEEIASAIMCEYAVDLGTASKDVGQMLAQLNELKLLVRG